MSAPVERAALTEKSATLRALHVPGRPLVLPNVWDAGSARVVVDAGFPVVATGSAAVARSLGYDDGEATPAEEMLAAVARITRAVPVPVTADMERGYGMAPAELAERVAAAGAVGVNLEDSDPRTGAIIDPAEQEDFLSAVRAAAPELVINARADTFVHGTGSPGQRLTEAVERGRRYLRAGADCVFPILATDPAVITTLVTEIAAPVNILLLPGMPSIPDLSTMGVARISFGAGLHTLLQTHHRTLLDTITSGTSPFAPPQP
ncbi:isocitrate lyase/PEP mutase family protein [Sphaerisporangium aureirubrum]|uniref:Isocitrate lyase/phosphoenolpyruvate mutase family protein n=1 Tax=Sphaerisporangium aureirubrum TaxID=1544736 RepID=A0ABW1NBK6_9ACTN